MAFHLFDYLDWKIPKKMTLMSEKEFCEQNISFGKSSGFISRFNDVQFPFDLIRKTIILQSLINKKQIEENAELYNDSELGQEEKRNIIHSYLPYFLFNGVKIYVPTFDEEKNKYYDSDLEGLKKNKISEDVSDFNPFEYYGLDLFKSPFTRLILIQEDKTTAAFFHPELFEVFIINDQGDLDQTIPLFDSFKERPDLDNFFPRLKKVVERFYDFDRTGFINALHSEGFISDILYQDILLQSEKDKR